MNIIKMDSIGRITIPKIVRKKLYLNSNDSLEFFIKNKTLVLRKLKTNNECIVTGKIMESNFPVFGLTFSEEGSQLLLDEINKLISLKEN